MICDYCKYELQQDDYYWDFEFADVVICEECLGDFLFDLEEKHKKTYDPESYYIDLEIDLYREKRGE
jgi:hypothetical protein